MTQDVVGANHAQLSHINSPASGHYKDDDVHDLADMTMVKV